MAEAILSPAGVAAASAAGGPEPGFDQILARLREVVMRLESGELSLEQSLVVYEEGVALARRGQHLLASAEKLNQRIRFLSETGTADYSLNDKPAK